MDNTNENTNNDRGFNHLLNANDDHLAPPGSPGYPVQYAAGF
jgi:hypothetical protein